MSEPVDPFAEHAQRAEVIRRNVEAANGYTTAAVLDMTITVLAVLKAKSQGRQDDAVDLLATVEDPILFEVAEGALLFSTLCNWSNHLDVHVGDLLDHLTSLYRAAADHYATEHPDAR